MECFKWNDESEWYSEAHGASVVMSVTNDHETEWKLHISISGGTIYREIYGDDLDQAKVAALMETGRIVKKLREDWMTIVRDTIGIEASGLDSPYLHLVDDAKGVAVCKRYGVRV